LVESGRTDAGPRQRVVAHGGELNHDPERRWQRTGVFHNRQGESRQWQLLADDDTVDRPDEPQVVRVKRHAVGGTKARSCGDGGLARWRWHDLHRDDIVPRHIAAGMHTVRPADVIAIEVIDRLGAPCREFALAEHWYAATGLSDRLGVPDGAITKDRRYRTRDALRQAKEPIDNDLRHQGGRLFDGADDLLLDDWTSTYLEGLAEDNDLAERGYSRDHRRDGKPISLAWVVPRDGFPLAHLPLTGNTEEGATVPSLVTDVDKRFGKSGRVWVMERGRISQPNLTFLRKPHRR
jgi:hypothetical protein